jgi:hypothetical protein
MLTKSHALMAAAFLCLLICVLAAPARSQDPRQGLDSARGSERVVIHVDDDAGPGGDGSGRFPFDNIADALAVAASLGGAVVVVEPGQYPVSSTLRIQSSVDLRGSNVISIMRVGPLDPLPRGLKPKSLEQLPSGRAPSYPSVPATTASFMECSCDDSCCAWICVRQRAGGSVLRRRSDPADGVRNEH